MTENDLRKELALLDAEKLLLIAHQRARYKAYRRRKNKSEKLRAAAARRFVSIVERPDVTADVLAAAKLEYDRAMLAAELISSDGSGDGQ